MNVKTEWENEEGGGGGGGGGGGSSGKSFRFVRACERARRGEAAWASERRFDPVASPVRGEF